MKITHWLGFYCQVQLWSSLLSITFHCFQYILDAEERG